MGRQDPEVTQRGGTAQCRATPAKSSNVNLTERSVKAGSPPGGWYPAYIGGSGLAARLFWETAHFEADPLSPEAVLLFMNGPFAGLKLSGTSRMSVGGRSPLTGNSGDSSCGGYFGPELRYAGYDGIVLRGRTAEPTLLLIEDDRIEIADASSYWGKGVEEVNSALKERFGKNHRTLVIGPAGENMVRYALILSEFHHAFGRAGFGAVMGSKNLKAIVVKASKRRMEVADPKRYEKLRKELNTRIKENLTNSVFRESGTAANLEGGMFAGNVPIRNFASNFSEDMGEALSGITLTEKFLTRRGACEFCSVKCKRIVKVPGGPFAIPEGPGPEYETIVAFGALLGSKDLAAACKPAGFAMTWVWTPSPRVEP